jgi:S1-C subfamily serine protease
MKRGYIGIAGQQVRLPEGQRTDGREEALLVIAVNADGPAAKAGIVAGDIVLTVDGTPARSLRRIAGVLASGAVGRKAELRLIRGGMVLSLQATIEARPAQ